MTEMAGCREIRQALGVYVLGAIDPAERAFVDDHLPVCPECREELASLAGLPALLRRVPAAEAERLVVADYDAQEEFPPEDLLHSLLARTASVRRARRWRGLVAAAAVVVLAIGGGAVATRVLAAPSSPALASAWQTVSATSPQTGAHLTVKYASKSWGTVMDVQVSGVEPGLTCQFQVVDSSGHRWTVGGWTLSWGHGKAWYPASTSVQDGNLRGFQVTSGGQVLAVVHVDS